MMFKSACAPRGIPMRRRSWWPALALPLLAALQAAPAQADGTFFQFDVSSSTTSAVVNMARGPVSFGAIAVDYDGGDSYGVNALYRLPWGGDLATLRAGPSLGYERKDTGAGRARAGVKLVAERYDATRYGSFFVLADLNSIENAWFLLAQFGLSGPGITIEVSHGESDTYRETTLAMSRALDDGPVSLRAGYRFDAGEIFAGIAINTF